MKIDIEQLRGLPPEEAAAILYAQGRSLQGANLKKSSWLLIANGLHVQRISVILGQRLAAARSRPDALRVLRIARKWVRVRKNSQSARRAKTAQENPLTVALDTSPAQYARYEEEQNWDEMFMEEIWGHPRADYEEWLEEISNQNHFSRTRIPGLLAASTLQERIDR
jgi:hypothetical protein